MTSNTEDKVWSYNIDSIVQILPAGDWMAVFWMDGKRQAFPVDYMALVERVVIHLQFKNGNTREVGRDEPYNHITGVNMTDGGFEVCDEASNFLGMAKEKDVETVDYAAGMKIREEMKSATMLP